MPARARAQKARGHENRSRVGYGLARVSADPLRPAAESGAAPRSSREPVTLGVALLFGGALALALLLLLAPINLRPYAVAPAGIVGAVACELLARKPKTLGEPWRFDGYCVVLGTLALLGLGLVVGVQVAPAGWLLAATLSALGVAAMLPGAK
jgi:hypothetical protein